MTDYYQSLGVSFDANADEIKRAYRHLALKYHPDKNLGDLNSAALFRMVTEAYTILSDSNKRALYDREYKHKRQSSGIPGDYLARAKEEETPWSRWRVFSAIAILAVLVILTFILINPSDKSSSYSATTSTPAVSPDNGDLNSTFVKDPGLPKTEDTAYKAVGLTPEQIIEQEKNKLILEGWEETQVKNGVLPACYNFIPQKGKIDNYLKVQVGAGTDVAVKIMNLKTDKCVRYVFINSNSTFKIRNLPQGTFYLKIAYGKDWFSRVQNGQCVGKFLRNAMYEKGDETMDFNLKYTTDGYNIPSFQLRLDVIATDPINTFSSQDISEEDFNL